MINGIDGQINATRIGCIISSGECNNRCGSDDCGSRDRDIVNCIL